MSWTLFAPSVDADSEIDFAIGSSPLPPVKLLAIGLAGAETIALHESGDGTIYQPVFKAGSPVELSATNPSASITVSGKYRAVKPSTAGAVGVYVSHNGDP